MLRNPMLQLLHLKMCIRDRAWTVATPYLFAGQQMQVGRTVTVAFAMVVMATFLFFRYDVHITSARVRKAIIWLAGYSYTI